MRAAFFGALLALAPGIALAASFDCAKAGNAQEKAICATPALSVLDDKLAAAYKAVQAKLSPAGRERLLAGQRDWIAARARQCPMGLPKPDWMMDDSPTACLSGLYDLRIEELGKAITEVDGRVVFDDHRVKAMPRKVDLEYDRFPPFTLLDSYTPFLDAPRTPATDKWQAAIDKRIRAEPPKGDDGQRDETVVSFMVRGQVVAASDALIVSRVEGYYFSGGAHGMPSQNGDNWLLADGRRLAAKDLFGGGDKWKAPLAAAAFAALQDLARKDDWLDSLEPKTPADIAKTATDPENWLVTKDGLQVLFAAYETGPYAVGMPDPVVPWDKIKPLLAPKRAVKLPFE